MKSNFVVSAHRDMWLPNAKRLFAVDPYIVHVLEREGWFADYDEVQVAAVSRSTREEFIHDHEFVDRKFHQYSDILAQRLDELHGSNHGSRFWRKAFSLSILRHVTLCYDLYTACEINLKPMLHECRVLGQESYRIPVDFDEHRQMFQNTDFGREQLFSVYCGLYYPGRFTSWNSGTTSPIAVACLASQKAGGLEQRITRGQILLRIARKLLRGATRPVSTGRRILYRLLRTRNPRVGIMESYFSPKHMERLEFESWSRIQSILLPELSVSDSPPRWDLRARLVRDEPNFDRFDKFVFACLRHGMPRIFVEDFSNVYTQLNIFFDKYPELRWIVCEAWIGKTLPSLALAVLQSRNVKHIYNEHNYLSHFFLGSNLKYLVPLVDEFASLGWEDSSIPNLVRSASLFQWVDKDATYNKEHEILFVMSLPLTFAPEINAAYGESGAYRAQEYLVMNQRFLDRLGEDTLGEMYIRSYPQRDTRDWLAWDQAFVLAPYLSKAKVHENNSSISGKKLIQQSRLVVVNYLSTTYLESIIADIPTIFILNKDAYLLTEKYMGFFDVLIDAGVCQTNPEDAADFVNRIKDNPERWWRSSAVRKAKSAFLNANIGNPEVIIQHLLDKAK